MSKKVKISALIFLLLVSVVVLFHLQARRVILALIETQADENVEAKIGTLQLLPFKQSILLKNVSVSIEARDNTAFRRSSIERVYLEIGAQWDFLFGGTLTIEKLVCEGGELTMARKPGNANDTTEHVAFDLSTIFAQLKKEAIRFNIKDIAILDFNLTLLNDSTHGPTVIKHLEFHARDLYLSADSILKRDTHIEFGLPAQQIDLPHGPTTIKFDTLFFSTDDNSIQLNELEVFTSDARSGSDYRIISDKVRLAYFDFESLYTKGIVLMDTVFLGRSRLEAKMKVHDRPNSKKGTASVHPSLPYIEVRNLMVRELAADVQFQQEKIGNSIVIHNSFVTIQQLVHNPDSSQRLYAKDFEMLVSDYETLLNNKNTAITFDTVRFHTNGFALWNFNLSKATQSKPILRAPVFELKGVDWYSLLFLKKLVAEEAVAVDPIVTTTINPPTGSGGASQELVVLKSLKELLDVDLLSLKNASAYLNVGEGTASIALRGINASILTNRMLQSTNLDEVLEATQLFSFRNLTMNSADVNGRIDNFVLRYGNLYFQHIAYSDGSKVDLKLNGLRAESVSYTKSEENIAITGLGWESAAVLINGGTFESKSKVKNRPTINLSQIRGGNTSAHYAAGDMLIKTYFHRLNAESLELGKVFAIHGLDVTGSGASFLRNSNRLSIKSFSFADMGSVLEDIRWDKFGPDTLGASIKRISFMADFNLLPQQQVSIPSLDVLAMRVEYSRHDSTHRLLAAAKTNVMVKGVRYDQKKLSIGSLRQTIDSIYYLNERQIVKEMEVPSNKPINERWKLRNRLDSLMEPTSKVGVPIQKMVGGPTHSDGTSTESRFTTQSTVLESRQNGLVLSASNIETFSLDSATQVKASLDSLGFSDLELHHNDLHARIEHGTLKNLVLNSGWLQEPMKMLRANYPSAAVHNLKASLEMGGNLLRFDQFDYYPLREEGRITGFEHRPLKDKEAFLNASFFQTNFMHTRINSISFHHFDAERFAEDSTVHLRAIRVAEPRLQIDRDKTHPFYSGKIKLLPTNAFQQLGMKFKIDSLQFKGGNIVYTEKSKVTSKEGSIHFTEVNGLVRNIKNIELREHDTLFIRASARFLDSANVNLRVRESYQDTLAGFVMTTQVSPFHTSILNPVLVPLVSVKFESGFIDTLQMHATGREHLSLGQMKFLYRDLKVSFLDQNDTSRHSIRNYILKFAANTLVIRTNNKKRIGTVYEVRSRNRAVFQYWVKMILSGITTSVGAKSNRSQIKKYQKELNLRRLPPIDESLAGF